MTEQQCANTQREGLYYSALVTGWITTKLERDKSILTLAAGGIGLVVTLMTTVGPTSCSMLWLYGLAVSCFLCSLIAVVIVLDKNGDHFEAVANGKTDREPRLEVLDAFSFWAFVGGAVFLAVIGMSGAVGKLEQQKEDNMASNSKNPAGQQAVERSVSGVGMLKPQPGASTQQGQQQVQSPSGGKETSSQTSVSQKGGK